ncbi:hypothetical protein ACU4GD_31615 [Cupriavidus basilensis]
MKKVYQTPRPHACTAASSARNFRERLLGAFWLVDLARQCAALGSAGPPGVMDT